MIFAIYCVAWGVAAGHGQAVMEFSFAVVEFFGQNQRCEK